MRIQLKNWDLLLGSKGPGAGWLETMTLKPDLICPMGLYTMKRTEGEPADTMDTITVTLISMILERSSYTPLPS